MRKFLLLTAAAALLAACSPPRPEQKADAPPAPPIVSACNDVAPDAAKLVELRGQTVAAASLPPELRGGPITPGEYDLSSGTILSVDAQPATLAAALRVSESEAGVRLDWAENAAGAETRWSALLQEGPPSLLVFSCGREGQAEISFGVEQNRLLVRWPDPARGGSVDLVLTRRG